MMRIIVNRSAVINAPVERVWAVLRDFNSHICWHPAVAGGQMENDFGGDVVGGVRRFTLVDGTEMREQLLHHSDCAFTLTYSILDSSLPLFDYVATVSLKRVTDGNQTLWQWRAQFRAPTARISELEDLVGRQLFEDGFKGLRTFLHDQDKPARQRSAPTEPAAADASAGDHLPTKAVVVTTSGGPVVLALRDVMVAPPTLQQVRIRQTAVAVNGRDLNYCRGTIAGLDLPGTPGVEGVGEIIDVGALVNGLFPGDRVAYMSPSTGAYAGIRCIDAKACISLPDGISDLDASTLLKGVTAGLLLSRVFRVVPMATILIQSVSGDMGHLLCQWAKSMELIVLGAVSTPEEAKFVRDYGCDHPIVVAADGRLPAEVMRITNGRGVDYGVHDNGAYGLHNTVACLARCGHCADIGDCNAGQVSIDVNVLKRRSLTVSAPVCFDYIEDRIYLHRVAHQLFEKIQNRTIIPVVETFPLSLASEAHKRIETRQAKGAVVLIPGT